MANANTFHVTPGQNRNLRACMVCSIVMLYSKFQREGCPNCEAFLQMAGSPETVAECTSQVFEGVITIADPKTSWVARWQRIDNYVPGVYAAKVTGTLQEEVLASLEENNIPYIPRDGRDQDDTNQMADA